MNIAKPTDSKQIHTGVDQTVAQSAADTARDGQASSGNENSIPVTPAATPADAVSKLRRDLALLQQANPGDTSSMAAYEEKTLPPLPQPGVAETTSEQTVLQVSDRPEKFGRYRIVKMLGEGGMGAVYLAEDPDLERKVALKISFFGRGDAKSIIARFRREAKSIAALQHPNICPIHEVSEVNGTLYMAMAFIEGKPLSDYLVSKKNQNIRAAVLLVRKIALALVEAHKRGIIHRDLKPANIMIDVRKEPIVMDFGLARRGNVSDTQLTVDGQMIGTPNYMPPEQVAGRVDEMGPACDTYSLGVLLYEMIAGRVPFQGDLLAILSQLAVDRPQPPSAYRNEIDKSLDAICLRALEKKPQDRYESMEAFAATLGDYLKTPSDRPSVTKTLVPEVAAPTANLQPAVASSPPRTGKRSWLMTAGGAGALLLLLGVIMITITNKDGTKTVINVPEGTETDLQVAPGSKVAITQPTTAPEMSSTTTESGWHGWPADAPAPALLRSMPRRRRSTSSPGPSI